MGRKAGLCGKAGLGGEPFTGSDVCAGDADERKAEGVRTQGDGVVAVCDLVVHVYRSGDHVTPVDYTGVHRIHQLCLVVSSE